MKSSLSLFRLHVLVQNHDSQLEHKQNFDVRFTDNSYSNRINFFTNTLWCKRWLYLLPWKCIHCHTLLCNLLSFTFYSEVSLKFFVNNKYDECTGSWPTAALGGLAQPPSLQIKLYVNLHVCPSRRREAWRTDWEARMWRRNCISQFVRKPLTVSPSRIVRLEYIMRWWRQFNPDNMYTNQ